MTAAAAGANGQGLVSLKQFCELEGLPARGVKDWIARGTFDASRGLVIGAGGRLMVDLEKWERYSRGKRGRRRGAWGKRRK
jgi:hypothetical protein